MKALSTFLGLLATATMAFASGPQPGDNYGDFDPYFVQMFNMCSVHTDLYMPNPLTGALCGGECEVRRAIWVKPHATLANRWQRDSRVRSFRIHQGSDSRVPSLRSEVGAGNHATQLKVLYFVNGQRYVHFTDVGVLTCG